MKKLLAAVAATVFCFAIGTAASADVTGDFKVTGAGYANDMVTVIGTVNNGAIQSGKNVAVDVTYEYSFACEQTVVIPGQSTTILVHVPGKCVTDPEGNASACFDKNGKPKATNGAIWTGTWETSTITTAPQTITNTFNGSAGMTAITEPTVERGRLNPKGRITGWSWASSLSIIPNADLVDPALIPPGYSLIPGSVVINSISFSAYLKDKWGVPIADTVVSGDLFP